jgi:ATP-dependent helicase/nuclease subunit A
MSTPSSPRLPFDDADGVVAAPVALPLDAGDRAAAVDPRLNVVLEASAGTGKTRVLVDRYVNLVRAGVEPRNILAITFTRKAAAEMRERILATLRRAAEQGGLDQRRWRGLSERLTDVAISTIDAFCLSLLREFPLEAGLDPAFGMADETEALRLMDEALDRALRICRTVAREDPAVALVFAELGDYRLREGLRRLLDRRLVTGPILDRAVRPTPRELTPARMSVATIERLSRSLAGVEGGLERFLGTGPTLHPRFQLLAADVRRLLMRTHDVDDPEREVRLLVDAVDDYFLTRNGSVRKRWPLYTAAHARDAAGLKRHRAAATAVADRLQSDLSAFRRDLNAVLTRGVWKLFRIARDEYGRVLDEHAVVDFPEALGRALRLLGQMGEFTRSRYLLESRYHHLLVDEFQDTSDAQWRLVWHLVQSWREGIGMSQDAPLPPTIFLVGDRKQSIYGFRDADARVLGRAAVQIGQLRADGSPLRAIRHSFRAVPPLLAFTNDLCLAIDKRPDRADAFTYEEKDRFPVPQIAGIGDDALSIIAAGSLEAQAEQVAGEIALLLADGSVRDRQTGVMRRASPGDVAILFRTREGHQAFEGALERRGIPSYVYKGLGFFDADEIKDVFALLRYLANPHSDLRAAALLRSRLVRLSDEGLAHLAPALAQAVVGSCAADDRLSQDDQLTLSLLRPAARRWLELADRLPPAELLDRVLAETAYAWELRARGSAECGLQSMESGADTALRIHQSRENLKKVRGLVRRIQNRGYATLGRVSEYLDRLSAGDESNAAVDAVNAVNLMTIHAAKGLEFPVVFLVNLGRGAGGGRDPIRVVVLGDDREEEAPSDLDAGTESGDPADRQLPMVDRESIAVSVGEFKSAADDDGADRDREELKRLLYVAVTRARDRLYLATTLGAGGRFEALRGGLGDVLPGDVQALFEGAATVGDSVEWIATTARHRFRVVTPAEAPQLETGRAGQHTTSETGDFEPLDPGPILERARISDDDGEVPAAAGGRVAGARADRRRLGLLVHRLLEQTGAGRGEFELSALDQAALVERAALLVAHDTGAIEAVTAGGRAEALELAHEAARTVLAMLGDPDVRATVQAGAHWHEVPLLFRDAGILWRGIADIVHAKGERVTVLEWKTGAVSPRHEAQLERYIRALRALFAGREVGGRVVYARPAAD